MLVPIARIRDEFPWWPYASDGTYRLIRQGRLGCVKVGRRKFVTRGILEACIGRHTLDAGPSSGAEHAA